MSKPGIFNTNTINLDDLDWSAPWADLQDELVERYSQALYAAGLEDSDDMDKSERQLRRAISWADSIISERAE